jgi:large subunit ribosomal protein L16
MFFPKNRKYNKSFMLMKKGIEYRTNKVVFGTFGIKAVGEGFIKSSHIETVRRLISKRVKRIGSFWIRIFPNVSITKKPLEVRMGKGKGAHSFWAFYVRKGRILFEIEGLNRKEVLDIVYFCNQKLPFKVKILDKN